MKRKGFTLIEMIAVVLIIGLLTLIVLPLILNQIQSQKENVSDASLNLIYDATDLYLDERSEEYPMKYGATYCVTLETLVNDGKLKSPIKDLSTGKEIALNKVVKTVVDSNNNGEYTLVNATDCEVVIPGGTGTPVTPVDKTKIYGVKRLLTTDSSAWERTDDSVGLVANAQVGTTSVQNDFDSIYPWSDIISYNYDTTTKEVKAYYGTDSFKFDGSNGEVLTYIPEFYYQRYQDDEYEYIYISKDYQEGYTKSEAFSVGRYMISGDSTRVYSRSGTQPLVNYKITDYRTYAGNLGSDFGIMDYHYFIIQLLYLVEYADYSSQAKLGLGYTNSTNPSSIKSGGCDTLGMHSGSADGTDKSSVIYRGIEDIFGNIYQFVDGINIKDNYAYICYNQSQYEVDKFDGCYQKIGYINASSNGFVSKLGYDSNHPLVALPIEVNGSNTDWYYQNSGNRIAIVGGGWYSASYCGLWYWSFNNTSSHYSISSGARLLKLE